MKKSLTTLLSFVLCISLFGLLNVSSIYAKDVKYPIEVQAGLQEKEIDYSQYDSINSEFDSNKAINADYRGKVYFDSNLINLDFVQSNDNSTYYRKDWKTMTYDEEGSIFEDYESSESTQNLILYGHYCYPEYDPSQTLKFTPLHQLKDESVWENNQYVKIQLEKEIRTYQICSVFYVYLELDGSDYYPPENMLYNNVEFDQQVFESYKNGIKENEFFDTGVEYGLRDKYLTLQTCVYQETDARLIVLGKLVQTQEIRE